MLSILHRGSLLKLKFPLHLLPPFLLLGILPPQRLHLGIELGLCHRVSNLQRILATPLALPASTLLARPVPLPLLVRCTFSIRTFPFRTGHTRFETIRGRSETGRIRVQPQLFHRWSIRWLL